MIYLDHSATTPVDKKVLKAILPYFTEYFGNPSSIHAYGQDAISAVDKAREQAAKFLNCKVEEIIFTSGATEANNLALFGVFRGLINSQKKDLHLITTKIEHPAILEVARALSQEGVKVSYLPVLKNGVLDLEEFKKTITNETNLVSIMYANNEVGSLQPIREVGKIIYKINEDREKQWRNNNSKKRGARPAKIYFHVDATQAVNFCNCDVAWNYIDLLSLSGHKIYGPKGVGLLYVKTGIPIDPLVIGGGQERGRRSGTLNVSGIVGLGAALDLLDKETVEKQNKKIAKLRDRLVEGIQKTVPYAVLNTDRENAIPSIANFSFIGVEGEGILISLDLEGIAVSTGSACASSKLSASHVMLAMGIKKEVAHTSIRFSLGKNTTEAEIKKTLEVLPRVVDRLYKMTPKNIF